MSYRAKLKDTRGRLHCFLSATGSVDLLLWNHFNGNLESGLAQRR